MIYTITLNPALDRELTVAAIAFDEVLRASETHIDVGGKGFNVSRMLAALGAESMALGFAGGGTGATLHAGLTALGIATDFVPISGETRTNISIVSADQHHYLKVNEPGPQISATEQAALLQCVRHHAAPGDWWVLAGSLPPGVPDSFYAELISSIQAAGGQAVLDTSGPPLHAGCAARPTMVKPNATELGQLVGRSVNTPGEALVAARALAGIPYVVVSLGAAGALLVHAGQGWLATPPPIDERNPIGAGDSLVAGFVWKLSRGEAHEALRWGVACGAATASHAGTALGTFTEVAHLAQQVQITSV